MLMTQLNRTYSATEYPDPVQARSAVAISGGRAPGDNRGQVETERGAAIAQPRRKALCDQRGLRSVSQVVRDKGQDDSDEDDDWNGRI